MFTATMRFVLPAEHRGEALRMLRSFGGSLCLRPACTGFDLLEDLQEEGAYMLVERWSSIEGLQRHIRSDGFRRLLDVMDMAERRPEFRLEETRPVEGIELLTLIRGIDGLTMENHPGA